MAKKKQSEQKPKRTPLDEAIASYEKAIERDQTQKADIKARHEETRQMNLNSEREAIAKVDRRIEKKRMLLDALKGAAKK